MATIHFDNWSRSNAKLLKTSLQNGEYDAVDVEQACQRAADIVDSGYTTKNQYAVPIFEPDGSRPTDEYVRFRPDQNQVRFYDTDKGRMTRCSVDDIVTTRLGQRLKWWLPDINGDIETLDEDKRPPESIAPKTQLSDAETTRFFNEMRVLVAAEQASAKEQNRDRFENLNVAEAIRRRTLDGPLLPLGAEQQNGDLVYKFQLTAEDDDGEKDLNLRDDAGIFEGNQYIVAIEGYAEKAPIEMKAEYVGTTELWLVPVNGRIPKHSPEGGALTDDSTTIWVHPLLNPTPFARRREAINQVEGDHEKRALLTGNDTVSFSPREYAVPDPVVDLNDSQERALVWAKAANDCVCIHGPPGTGKTRTLTAYIKAAVDRGQRVLVTAHSNQAVDNLLVGDSTPDNAERGTLHAIAQDEDAEFTIARAGSRSTNSVVQHHYVPVNNERADIVAATTSGAANFKHEEFDVGVVDEATQASRAATSIAFKVSKKLVLAGDHKQLPPYAASDELLGDEQRLSLFETLLNRYGDEIAVLLGTQYRMHKDIAAFSNQAFYDGDLATADRNRDWTINGLDPLVGINRSGTECKKDNSHSRYNCVEAKAAAEQVKLLLENDVPGRDIGVISPYEAQVGKIQDELNSLDMDTTDAVTVDTVDAFQGSEREAIIVSFARSNDQANSGFLSAPDEGARRLNVALTRGRKRLVLIGDWDTLGIRRSDLSKSESCARLYAELADSIRESGRMIE